MENLADGRGLTRRRLLIRAVGAAAASLPSWQIAPAWAQTPGEIRQTLATLVRAVALVPGNPIDVAGADVTASGPAVVRNGNSERVVAAVVRLRQNPKVRAAVADGPAATLALLCKSLVPNPRPPLRLADMNKQAQAACDAIAATTHTDDLSSLPPNPDAAAAAFFPALYTPEVGPDAPIRDGIRLANGNLAGSAIVVDAMTVVAIIAPPTLLRGEYVITEIG
jgi:hypothetical protein